MARRLALLFALLLSAVGISLSQQRPRLNTDAAADDSPIIRAGINLVELLVSVRDKKGAIAADLKQTDFRVLEDGKEQEIRHFTRETDLPLTIGMVVDVSGSVADEIPDEQIAARQFFNQVLRPQDQAFVISFAAQAELLQDTTSSINKLQNGLDDLSGARPNRRYFVPPSAFYQFPFPGAGQYPGSGRSRNPFPGGGGGTPPISGRRGGNSNKGTVLYDAVFLASDEVLKPLTGRKAIILITDGEDQGSLVSLSEAVETTLKADTIVYSIFVKRDTFGNGSEDVLQRLSGETGGRVFTLQRRNLDKIFKEIEEELRSQYSISYVSSNQTEDGGFRRLDVQMRDKTYSARTRKGYFAALATH